MYRVLRLANLKFNQVQLLVCFPGGGIGAGVVGIWGVQLASGMGSKPIVVDTGAEREQLVMSKGAKCFVDFKKANDTVVAVIMAADGIGAHGVFVTTGAAYLLAIAYTGTRAGPYVTCIGLRK